MGTIVTDVHRCVQELYCRYHGRIYRYARSMVRDHQAAQDIMQQTFEQALRALPSLRASASVRSWLFAIAHNQTMTVLRDTRGSDGVDPESLPGDTSPLDSLMSSEIQETVRMFVDRLKPEYRQVLLLREFEQMSYREIASVLGESADVVRMRLLRSRRALAKNLRRHFPKEDSHGL